MPNCPDRSASVLTFGKALAVRLLNLTTAIKMGRRLPCNAMPEIIAAVVNLSNALHAVEGRRAAMLQSMHALALLPFLDLITARQLLVQTHSAAEAAGKELGPDLEFDESALELSGPKEHAGGGGSWGGSWG
jgi:hypothetical protein